ncbi:MAG: InlB B-repeat-containing protein [Bacillota bacterium]
MQNKKSILIVLLVCVIALFAVGCNETEVSVTFDCNNGSEAIVSTIEDGDFDMISDPVRDGYTFSGWFTSEEYDEEFDLDTYTYDYNVELYAKWVLIKVEEEPDATIYHTLEFVCNGGSEIADIVVEEGETFAMPTDPTYEGYTFNGWYLDDECIAPYTFDGELNVDTTLYASWTQNRA